VAIRLWEEAATASLPEHEPPEIFEADLSSLLLTCLMWGEAEPQRLPFLDAPPHVAIEEARRRLRSLGAMDDRGRVTSHGRAIAALPLEPRLAHMLLEAGKRGFGAAAADVAVLLTERGLGGNDLDLEVRRRRWRSDKSARASAALGLAAGWRRRIEADEGTIDQHDLGKALALAFPDRVARRRDGSGEAWQSVGGRAFRLDPSSSLARNQWIAVGEVAGHARGARILSAAAIDEQVVLDLFADAIEVHHDGEFDAATGSVTPTRTRRLGAIRLATGPDPAPDQAAIEHALLEGVREHGLPLLPWNERSVQLRHRAAFAHRFDASIAALDDNMLFDRAGEWLVPLLAGRRRLGDIPADLLASMLEQLLGYESMQKLDRLAPSLFTSPAGSRHPIDYSSSSGPLVEVRAQALFGLTKHPAVANGQVPLILAITSPAGRPIQTTKDLPGFWRGSWLEVAKDMRGRYPKHPWPQDPASASPTLRTKRLD
jgi:ATP-dependent helicase HrpB